MRSKIFNACFYAYTFAAALLCLPLVALPWRKPLAWATRMWAKGVVVLMRTIAGIRVEVRGREHLPKDAPVVLAGKHQSECDGIIVLALVPDIAFVAMKEVAQYPLLGPLLRKLQMVLVDTCGGGRERATLLTGSRAAADDGRSILIYPEGTLMAVGETGQYKAGVYHLAVDLGLPVVPVATNVGLRWDRRNPLKTPGMAVVEFLPPIEPANDKTAFMARLEETIETTSDRLAQEQAGGQGAA